MLELIVSVRDFVRATLSSENAVLGSWGDDFSPYPRRPATRLGFRGDELIESAPSGPALRRAEFELALFGGESQSGELLAALDAMLELLPVGSEIPVRPVTGSGDFSAQGAQIAAGRLSAWREFEFGREPGNEEVLRLAGTFSVLVQTPPGGFKQ